MSHDSCGLKIFVYFLCACALRAFVNGHASVKSRIRFFFVAPNVERRMTSMQKSVYNKYWCALCCVVLYMYAACVRDEAAC